MAMWWKTFQPNQTVSTTKKGKTMSSKLTKDQLIKLVHRTLQLADQNGNLDDLCHEGQDLVNELAKAVNYQLELDYRLTFDSIDIYITDHRNQDELNEMLYVVKIYDDQGELLGERHAQAEVAR